MALRSTATAVLLAAAAGLAAVAAGLLFGAPFLMASGVILAVSAGIVAVALSLVGGPPRAKPRASSSGASSPSNASSPVSPPADADRPDANLAAAESAALLRLESPSSAQSGPARGAYPAAPRGGEPVDVLEAFSAAVSETARVLGAHLWLYDETTETMRLVAAVGDSEPEVEPVRVSSSALGKVVTAATAVLEPLGSQGAEKTWRYAIPLSAGQARGAAAVDIVHPDPDRGVINREAAYLRGPLAAALALHVSRTETAAARALLDAAGAIVRLIDAESICDEALDRAIALSGAHSGSVMLLDEERGRMVITTARGLPDRVVAETTVGEGDGVAGWVLATGQPLVVEDLEDKGPRSRRHGIRSAAAVPIADDEGMLGVLNVGSKTFHARFSATHLQTLVALGRILALALRNASAVATSRELYLDTVKALALALETKDPYSRGATERVFELASRLGRQLAMSEVEYRALRVASLVHDIGMVAAGDLASLADRPLTTVEWGMLKMHPVIAADVLEQAPALREAIPVVYHHHEHYDGSGYVQGLSADEIPLGARVLSVADAYVSMTSPRAYRSAFSHDQALAELEDKAGSQFDPKVVAALCEVLACEPELVRS